MNADQAPTPYVRIAQLEIDPDQVNLHEALAREAIEASVRTEPGVLALHAVADRESPNRILILEVYADEEAYRRHLESPHFKKYKAAARDTVRSLKLMDAVPIVLAAKTK